MKKDFVVDKNSWHFKFINTFEHWDKQFYPEEKMPKDFCSYWAKFVWYVFAMAVIPIGFIAFGLTIFVLIFLVPTLLISGIYLLLYYAMIVISVLITSGMIYYKSHKDNIFAIKYYSWKDKYCPMVTYK